MPMAVVLGLSPTALHVIRTLGHVGVRVIGVGAFAQAGSFSRHLSRRLSPCPKLGLLRALYDIHPTSSDFKYNRPVLIPTSDEAVEFIVENAQELACRFEFQDSYKDGGAALALSKDRFYSFCRTLGVEVPSSREIEPHELPSLEAKLAYPCIVKPAQIHRAKTEMGGRKAWVLRDSAEFEQMRLQIPQGIGTLIIQEIIPGPESEIAVCCLHRDRQGNAKQVFTARKLRQFPPGFGSASLVESEQIDEVVRLSLSVLEAMNYHGIAALEFKRRPATGEWVMIEMNARPSLWFGLSEAAGRRPVLSSFLELARYELHAEELPQTDGVRWRYFMKDAYSAQFYRNRRNFVLPPPRITRRASGRRQVGAVFSPRDPGPVVGEVANLVKKLISRTRQAI